MNSVEILEGSIPRIEAGWCKHSVEDEDGNVCAMGAAMAVAGGIDSFRAAGWGHWERIEGLGNEEAYLAAWNALNRAVPEPFEDLVEFNNAGSSTRDDVISVFRKATRDEKARFGIPLEIPAARRVGMAERDAAPGEIVSIRMGAR